MKAPTVKNPASKKRTWLRRILITLAVIILLPIGLFTIGWLNRDSVIDVLQEWYKENNSGTLSIGSVNANFLSGFPNVQFTLKDIKQTANDTITDEQSSVSIDEAKLTIGAANLMRGNIVFKKIALKNAAITSKLIAKRPAAYYELLNQKNTPNDFKLPNWLQPEGAEFSLQNITYTAENGILNKYFNFDIHSLNGVYKGKDAKLKGNLRLDVTVNNLGFNTKKGSFFNGAHVSGRPNFTIDLNKDTIEFEAFDFNVDEQVFQLAANFDLSEANTFHFLLDNTQTDFEAVKGLLTANLAEKIKNYEIKNPIETHLDLSGSFDYGNDPDVKVTFSTDANSIQIADKFQFSTLSFNGYLTTDVYETDSLRLAKKTGYDIKIAFDAIDAQIEDVTLTIRDAYYQSTPDAINFVKASAHLKGSNEGLASILETDNFDFRGGAFDFKADILGDIPDFYQLLNNTKGNFDMDATRIILKKNGLQLPIQAINLSLDREHTTLRQLVVNLPNGENLVLIGHLKNISGIISKSPNVPTTSQISLNSKDLDINELLSMAKELVPASEAKANDRKTLHETLEAIYNQFHPQFSINLETLRYNDVTLSDLNSNISLIDSETIQLDNFDFRYDEALTNLKGRVVVHGPDSRLKDAIYIDAEATSSGPITVFRDLFDIKLVRIDTGDFLFYGNVTGNVKEFSELLNNARGNLNLTNTKLFYEPADMDIAIDSMALFVDKSDIFLEKLNLEVGELYPINLNGSIREFPSFLLDSKLNSGSIKLKVSAPYVDGDDLLATISSFKNDSTAKAPKTRKAMHQLFKDINKFNPNIELAIDSLKYDDLITKQINAQLYFENDSILKLNNLDVAYKNTAIKIKGKVNAHADASEVSNTSPFDFDFSVNVKGKSADLNDYLKTTNFIFTSGDFEFEANYNAESEDLMTMNSKTFGDLKISHTLVDFESAGLQIPIDSLHLSIHNDVATLKTLDVDLPGKSSVYFAGTIDHFSDFINNSQGIKRHSSDFLIRAPYLATNDIEAFLSNTTSVKDTTQNTPLNLQKFKLAMSKINTSFYPTVTIKIDTLKHKDFNLNDFGMNLLFDANDNFKIKDTQLDFYGGSITLNADIGLRNDQHMPVTIDMQATNVNLHELVTRFDYFNDDALREAEKIEGILNYHIKATGTVDNEGKLNTGSLNGTFELSLNALELYNYAPIMENSVMMKDERFKNLRFQPIVQTFNIVDGELIIPRTEIQSTAIQVFVEGRLKFNEYMDIWLSLPWKNLKSNDGLTLPEKTTYDAAGSKFYVQLLQDKTAEKPKKQQLKTKIRFSNRKLKLH